MGPRGAGAHGDPYPLGLREYGHIECPPAMYQIGFVFSWAATIRLSSMEIMILCVFRRDGGPSRSPWAYKVAFSNFPKDEMGRPLLKKWLCDFPLVRDSVGRVGLCGPSVASAGACSNLRNRANDLRWMQWFSNIRCSIWGANTCTMIFVYLALDKSQAGTADINTYWALGIEAKTPLYEDP